MEIHKEILENKSLFLVIDEHKYEDRIDNFISSLKNVNKRICYVCMNKKYEDVLETLKELGVDHKNFYFIDVLSSHYVKHGHSERCSFVSSPHDLEGILRAMKYTIARGCDVFFIDTISTLLIYKSPFSVLRFVHDFLALSKGSVRKTMIALKGGEFLGEEREQLIKDGEMLTEKSILVD
jgi:archaellum biogenesis ATPase FlaH